MPVPWKNGVSTILAILLVALLFPGCVGQLQPNESGPGLMCYQCETFGRRADPNCSNFTESWSGERQRFLSCPLDAGFCFKRTTLVGRATPRTRRGCLAATTRNGHRLRSGCVETWDRKNVGYLTCVCSTNWCNRARPTSIQVDCWWTFVALVVCLVHLVTR